MMALQCGGEGSSLRWKMTLPSVITAVRSWDYTDFYQYQHELCIYNN